MAAKKFIICVFVMVVMAVGSTQTQASMRYWSEAVLPVGGGVMTLPQGQYKPFVTASGGRIYNDSIYSGTYFLGPAGFTRTTDAGYDIISGPDGEIAVISGGNGQIYPTYGLPVAGEINVLRSGTWQTMPQISIPVTRSTMRAAFTPDGSFRCAFIGPEGVTYAVPTRYGWSTILLGSIDTSMSGVVVDSYGCTSILTANLFFSNGINGQWQSTVLPQSTTWWKDIAVSCNDVVGIIGTGSDLYYATYSPQQQEWIIDTIAGGVSNAPAAICFDNLGNPAVAYEDEGIMHFAINDGSGAGWVDSIIGSFDANYASLAFDPDNNPVVCFGGSSQTRVYYDPVVVPEPLAALLLLAGAWGIRRARRS